jgi:hypothetical protein
VSPDDVRRRLRSRADELGLDFQQALQYYAMERFLFRLSQSAWSERFIVKGAVMLRVWAAAVGRPTRDIDFLGRIDNTPDAVRAAVLECLAVEAVDDGIVFSEDIDVVQAMVDDRYPGIRVKIRGDLEGARVTLRLDIGIDDATVPESGWLDYPALLDAPAPRILAYVPATAVAEKFEAIVSLGLIKPPAALTNEFVDQSTTARMWRTYRARLSVSGIDAPTELAEVVDLIKTFIMPRAAAAAQHGHFPKAWTSARGWV